MENRPLPEPPTSSSSLGAILLRHGDEIAQEWYVRWAQFASRHGMEEAALKNDLPRQLRWIAEAIESGAYRKVDPKSLWQEASRLHPEARVTQKVPIEEMVEEYDLLVDVVRNWIEDRSLPIQFAEFSFFYKTIFGLVAESVRRFAKFQAEGIKKDRSEYLAGLMHQMRTPLSSLSLRVTLIEESKQLDTEMVRGLRESIKRLSLLVNGVMRLERFKPEDLPVRPESIRVATLVDQVVFDNEHEALRKGLRFEVHINRTIEMRADYDLILDALGNLVENAVKYTESGFVRVRIAEEPDSVVFHVEDSGPGIPAERQKELFKTLNPAKSGGVGIGLLIAHRAVAAQGGEIGLTSDVSKGTSFRFKIPRDVKQRAQPIVPA